MSFCGYDGQKDMTIERCGNYHIHLEFSKKGRRYPGDQAEDSMAI